ncbi:DUF805 domain-containing protein [Levilactobacillus huananensis]|uniref:DUF805 domain-containing protein n=1 Tax=Levilactobacillus huananensis TaxID=2486019 RepID=UPI0013DDFF00|nr:DUF805 domain-containing protein [Levilactobacillus huananensis]
MNFCPKCGTAVKAGARFCPNCGFDLQVKGTPAAPAASASVQPAPQQQVQPQTQFQQQATMSAPIPQATGSGAVDYQSNLGFVGAVKQYFQGYAKFDGRMSLANYWLSAVGISIITMLGYAVAYSIDSATLFFLVGLVFVLPGITSAVRRLHDTNHSGVYYFWAFLPVVGSIYLLVLLFTPGDQQANRFG